MIWGAIFYSFNLKDFFGETLVTFYEKMLIKKNFFFEHKIFFQGFFYLVSQNEFSISR